MEQGHTTQETLTLREHLIQAFGKGTDLSDIRLAELEDEIYSWLTAESTYTTWAPTRESAEDLAAKYDGTVL